MDNLENGYTEELDFSNLQEEMEKIKEEVKPVPLEPMYEEPEVKEVPLEPVYEEKEEDEDINENPYAKITLKKDEEQIEQISHKEIKVDLWNNKSLIRVLLLGLVLLLVIVFLPLLFEYLG